MAGIDKSYNNDHPTIFEQLKVHLIKLHILKDLDYI